MAITTTKMEKKVQDSGIASDLSVSPA
ncbi:hypothetical protein CCACVL1_27329 [Corchorus capsularis]|uniref:Uncharacterized protein n=1 Tax=Corchorus capsularis TaxID=210143 RepID=A0A1R3GB08_COCAP|nr:hypothetical protein CCACVL1_27329 [Corchorus capsularis]